jgi:hypothetical protein
MVMSRRSNIMVVDESPEQIHHIGEAFLRASWLIGVDGLPPGKPTVDALYHQYQAKIPVDLVMLSAINDTESCLDTLRIIRNYPALCNQAIIVLAPPDRSEDLIHSCHRLGALKCLEWPIDISAQVLLVMEIKSHFSPNGALMPGGSWTNSSRLTIVRVLTDRIEKRILSTP